MYLCVCVQIGKYKLYKETKTPFLIAHSIQEDLSYISYADLAKNFFPAREIGVNKWVAVVQGKSLFAGELLTFVNKSGSRAGCWLQLKNCITGRPKLALQKNCVGGPAMGEYVRHVKENQWYKVTGRAHKLVCIQKVLVPEQQPSAVEQVAAPAPAQQQQPSAAVVVQPQQQPAAAAAPPAQPTQAVGSDTDDDIDDVQFMTAEMLVRCEARMRRYLNHLVCSHAYCVYIYAHIRCM